LAVEGRTHRPVVDALVCGACSICVRGCPAEFMPEMRTESDSLRGAVYQTRPPQAGPRDSTRADTPPCQASCPLDQDVPGYVRLLSEGRIQEALDRILEANPLPAVCGHVCTRPCERACTRGSLDSPVPVRALKEAAARIGRAPAPHSIPSQKSGFDVAVVGSGPAGLSAARDLALQGLRVQVLELNDRPGGMLSWAIPAFRLPLEALEADVARIQSLGVDIRTGIRFGNDITWEDLRREGIRALLLATGTMKGVRLGIPGEKSPGVHDALAFLRLVSRDNGSPPGERVLVVGGGNAALDAARTALRLGSKSVSIVYRRGRDEMPADPAEVREAEREGVSFRFLTAPMRVAMSEEGPMKGLTCVRIELRESGADRRPQPVPLPGTEHEIAADALIMAVGQVPDPAPLIRGLSPEDQQRFRPDPVSLETSCKGVFAAGDFVHGSTTVVEAMASGKRAAHAITAYLHGLAAKET